MTPTERLHRDYRTAFLRYLPRREESARHTAYQLGRQAVDDAQSVLDVAVIHHMVLLEVLADAAVGDELVGIASAASEFFIEFLAPFEMERRGYIEAPDG